MMDIHQILKKLPHRYPFLLVDRVLELEKGKRIKALKNVTINEPFFGGHFPHRPVMPGVLMLEAMAQAAALLSFDAMGRRTDENTVYYFAGIDGARFKRPVEPGDQLMLEVELDRAQVGHLQVQGARQGRRRARRRGRADVHDAQRRLRPGRGRGQRSTPPPSSIRGAELARDGHGRPLHADRPAGAHRRGHDDRRRIA